MSHLQILQHKWFINEKVSILVLLAVPLFCKWFSASETGQGFPTVFFETLCSLGFSSCLFPIPGKLLHFNGFLFDLGPELGISYSNAETKQNNYNQTKHRSGRWGCSLAQVENLVCEILFSTCGPPKTTKQITSQFFPAPDLAQYPFGCCNYILSSSH